MKKRIRVYSEQTKSTLAYFGSAIKMNRKLLNMPEAELAERIGVSRSTVQRIEAGDLKSEIGLVFQAASVVGLSTMDDSTNRSIDKKNINQTLALLPQRIRKVNVSVENDF